MKRITGPVGTHGGPINTDLMLNDEQMLAAEEAIEHGIASGGEVAGSGSMARQMLRVFIQNKLAVTSAIFIFLLVMGCIIVPLFYSQSYWTEASSNFSSTCFPNTQSGNLGNAAPSLGHLLGCTTGYDNVALVFYSGRFSLAIGGLAGVVTIVVGTLYGIIAGYKGGKTDAILMRINDVFLSIPGLYLLLLVIAIYGSSLNSLIAVIGFTSWFGVARLMRGEAQIQRDREFSQAARSMGATSRRVMWKHVLPNSVSTMMTAATFAIGDAVIVLSVIGYLGLALNPPDSP
ncbi:MAG TPA: ABC transporter permease, partial [Acidimicrobiales bacterium]|nr:ABC transporter permease [Acidimicrobiales bacterium]